MKRLLLLLLKRNPKSTVRVAKKRMSNEYGVLIDKNGCIMWVIRVSKENCRADREGS